MNKNNIEAIYSLTPLQEGILYHKQLNETSTEYFLRSVIKLEGHINIQSLKQSLKLLSIKYEVLRTAITTPKKSTKPWQVVRKESDIELVVEDLSELTEEEQKKQIEKIKSLDLQRGFDLEKDSLIRLTVIKLSKIEHYILWSTHHIIMDGWCISILFKDFLHYYGQINNGIRFDSLHKKIESEKRNKGSYGDYIKWLEKQDKEKGLTYWREMLHDYDEKSDILPLGTSHSEEPQVALRKINFTNTETEALERLAREQQVTINTIIESAWGLLLQRYNRSNDAVFGKVVSGRNANIKGIEEAIGLFINTIPLRVKTEENMSCGDLIKSVQNQAFESMNYDYCPLAEIQNESPLKGSLFDTLFVFENYYADEKGMDDDLDSLGFGVQIEESREETNYPITVSAYLQETLTIELMFNLQLYSVEEADTVLERLKLIIAQMVSEPELKIQNLNMLSEQEEAFVTTVFNDTDTVFPDKTVIEIFENQVKENPEKVAVTYNDQTITYEELNNKANQLAHKLRRMGVERDDFVGLICEKSIEMIVGIYGVLKAGAAYIPIDITYPDDRIDHIISDSKPTVLLVGDAFHEFKDIHYTCPIINLFHKENYLESSDNPTKINSPNDLIYAIYTSGTTGKPKGVLLEHRGVTNLVYAYKHLYQMNSNDVLLQFARISFDQSVWDIFTILSIGGTLCIAPESIRSDSTALENYMNQSEVSVAALTPSLIKELNPKNLPTLRTLESGGEVVQSDVIQKWLKDRKVFNTYGPTETTVNVISYNCTTVMKEYPIGRPIANIKAYIMNNDQLCGIGIPGELCIAGEGVARGYLNRDDLSQERFIKNPFGNGRLYRSGDLARYLPDGNVEYLGRIDEQVKIRGFRVELGEVETVLRKIRGIQDAVVLTTENNNNEKVLAAYIVSNAKTKLEFIQKELKKDLPEYMIPSLVEYIPRIPINNNGKRDVGKLPKINMKSGQYIAPRNETEKIIVDVFEEILEKKSIGVMDNFFSLGGHSLRATRAINQIEAKTGIRIPIKEMFTHPNANSLSVFMKNLKDQSFPIPVAEEKPFYQMSSSQKRLFIINEFDDLGTVYNMPGAIQLEGQLEIEKIQEVCTKLIERHEVLKTSFHMIGEQPVQKISDNVNIDIDYEEVEMDDNNKKDFIINILSDFIKPFDLTKAPLFRMKIVKYKENHSLLLFDMHHIISDGETFNIIARDFTSLYNDVELAPVKVTYKDYSEWMTTRDLSAQEKYWVSQFNDEIPVIDLPTDYERPYTQSFRGSNVTIDIPEKVKDTMESIQKSTGTTEHMIFLSTLMVLLHKYSQQEDIIIGSPISGRIHKDIEDIAGIFINTMALRGRPSKDKTFERFLGEIKETSLNAHENQEFPFEDLVERVNVTRDLSRNPLFDVMFVLENNEKEDIETNDLLFGEVVTETKVAKFDLTVTMTPKESGYSMNWEYSTDLFKASTIERMAGQFSYLLDKLDGELSKEIGDINVLTDEQKQMVVQTFNQTKSNYSGNKNVVELFQEQVKIDPSQVAVHGQNKVWTYGEIDEFANRVANELIRLGIKSNDIIALHLPRSPELIISILGTLKSGGIFLPIDRDAPIDRKKQVITDSLAKLVIVEKDELNPIGNNDTVHVSVDTLIKNNSSVVDPNGTFDSDDGCYCIYTSGSSGQPKGVVVSNKNLVNYLHYSRKTYVTGRPKIPLFTNMSFDLTMTSVFLSLCFGGELFVYDQGIDQDLNNVFQNENLTLIKLTPSHLKLVCENPSHRKLPHLQSLIVGGEELDTNLASQVNELFGSHISIHNEYGPTETTIGCCDYVFNQADDRRTVLIGKPISNMRMYIMNGSHPCGVGMKGELCIAGTGVTNGYLNRPELTKEKFVDNPLFPGDMLYRSGDMARWLPDGNIEFLGRIDEQVKIRGYRIELDEIEHALRDIDFIQDVAVIAESEEERGEKHMCAYLVSDRELDMEGINIELKRVLPDFMVPTHLTQIEKIPLTSNGKLDKNNLPKILLKSAYDYVMPKDDLEIRIISVYETILGVSSIGMNDNFFELGGHSLKAMKLVNKIEHLLGVRLTMKDVFTNPTPAGICRAIRHSKVLKYELIPRAHDDGEYPMSSSQKRLFVIQEMDVNQTTYNIPFGISVEGDLDLDRVSQVFKEIVNRHEVFRTVFYMTPENAIQKVVKGMEVEIEFDKLDYLPSSETLMDEFVKPFNLAEAPLVRMKIIQLQPTTHILLFDMHHIVSDEVSMNILIEEFSRLYAGEHLEEMRIHYKDYSEWLKTKDLSGQRNYWLEEFNELPPVLELPTDFTRPPIQSFRGGIKRVYLDKHLNKAIKTLCQKTQTTEYMLFLSSLMVLLGKYSHQDEMVIGSPVSGRNHKDTEKMIGMFVNTLVIRGKPEISKTFYAFLQEIKDTSLKAFENQEYPFEELIEQLKLVRDLSRNPLFDVMFVFENMNEQTFQLDDLTYQPLEWEERSTKFDLTINVSETEDGYMMNFAYCSDLFTEKTIDQMICHFKHLILEITQDVHQHIGDLPIIDGEEKKMILETWNQTATSIPSNKSIVDLFEQVVWQNPQKTALNCDDMEISYDELNRRANYIAKQLIERGVTPDDFVAIISERSLEFIIGILGIIKAGGAYVPIDPNYPVERVNYILSDSKPKAVLVGKENKIDHFNVSTLNIFVDERQVKTIENPNININPDNLVYCMYTSGTTGKPKGVMIEHKNVIRLVKNANYMPLDESTVFLKTGALSFDASTFEIWGALLNGGSLCLPEKDILSDTTLLKETIQTNNINTMFLTTSLYNQLIEVDHSLFDSLYYLLVGGEKLSEKHVRLFKEHNQHTDLINGYGPTEVTTLTTTYSIPTTFNSIPIGRPISNTEVYIMQNEQLCGVGVPGELCIAGDGVGRGYLNQPELTREKFIPNPFGEGKMYKSGDLVRWLHDGTIEYLGRMDEQVKIRGFRIELGEIEAAIRKIPSIENVAVISREYNRVDHLCAYLVSNEDVDIPAIKSELQKVFPEFMIPGLMLQIPKLPLTAIGKLDKKKLPVIEFYQDVAYVAPRDEIEIILSDIWAEVLYANSISIGIDNHFFQLGGDSIRAIRVTSKLRAMGYYLNVRDILTKPTIRQLKDSIIYEPNRQTGYLYEKDEGNVGMSKETRQRLEEFSQKYDSNLADTKQGNIYHMSAMQKEFHGVDGVPVKTVVDIDDNHSIHEIVSALNRMVADHDVFRSYIDTNEQKILIKEYSSKWSIPVFVEESSGDEQTFESELTSLLADISLFESNFLAKLFVYHDKDGKSKIFVFVHHMVWDGMSNDVFADQLRMYLTNSSYYLPKEMSYHSYINNINKELGQQKLLSLIKYSHFREVIKSLRDFTRVIDVNREKVNVWFSIKTGNRFIEFYEQNPLNIFIYLLDNTVFKDLDLKQIPFLQIYHGRSDIFTDYSDTLGLFLDLIPSQYKRGEKLQELDVQHDINKMMAVRKKENIHYISLFEELSGVDEDIDQEIKQKDIKTLDAGIIPVINFLGIFQGFEHYEGEYFKIIGDQENFLFEIKHTDDTLHFNISCYKDMTDEIVEQFKGAIRQIEKYIPGIEITN